MNRTRLAAALALALLASWSAPRGLHAQAAAQGKTIEAKGMKGVKGPNPNIKVGPAPNSTKGAKPPAPPSMGGAAATKGTYGLIYVRNRTGLYIELYVDGGYRGTVGPWSDISLANICGTTTLYAQANFDDGSFSYWGPTTDNFCSTTWTLTP